MTPAQRTTVSFLDLALIMTGVISDGDLRRHIEGDLLNQRVEASVLRDDVKEAARVFGRETAKMKGDVEVQRVCAG